MSDAQISDEQKKKLGEVEKALDTIFKSTPYAVSITILEKFEQKENNKAEASYWAINRIGSLDVNSAPFTKVNALLQAFSINAQSFIQGIYKVNIRSGKNEGSDSN